MAQNDPLIPWSEEELQRRQAARFAPGFIDNLLTARHEYREQQVINRVHISTSPENMARIARFAELLPDERKILDVDLKEPTLRGAVNTVLGTLTGGVITLDAVDEHLQTGVLGLESPLAKKMQSLEVLKVLDPGGNIAEAWAREQFKRQGLPPELVEKGAGAIGLVASLLTPGSILKSEKARRIATEVYINSLFSGPQTQVSNLLANAIVSAYVIPERALAAGTDLALSVIKGKQREVYFGEAAAMTFGMANALTDAAYAGLKTFVTGKSSFGGTILEDVAAQARASQRRIKKELFDEETTVIREGIDYWGMLWRSPTRGLGATDEFFKIILANGERYALAYRAAVKSRPATKLNLEPLLTNIEIEEATKRFTTISKTELKEAAALSAGDLDDRFRAAADLQDQLRQAGRTISDPELVRANELAGLYHNLGMRRFQTGEIPATTLADDIRARLKRPAPNVRKQIQDFAIINTFQRDLRSLPGVIGGVGRLGQTIQEIPMGRLIVPVIRTPTNLAHFTAERTPILGMFVKTFRDDVAAGGARASQALAKQAAGATLFASFVQLGAADIITGNGPADPNLRLHKQELTGWQPASLRIGNAFHSINRLEPVGAMLVLAADFGEIVGHLSEREATEVAHLIGLAITDNIIDGRFMTGALDVFDAITGKEDAFKRAITGTLKRITPAGGALRAATGALDPVRRELDPGADPEDSAWAEARLIMNLVRSQIPEYSKTLFPRRNIFGFPVETPKGLSPEKLSPVFTTLWKDDPTGEEVIRLAEGGHLQLSRVQRVIMGRDPEQHPPDELPSPMDTGIELTDAEYDELQRLAGNELKIDGKGLYDTIYDLATKDKEFEKMNDVTRGIYIGRLISGYRRAAIGQLLENNPGLLETFEERAAEKERAIEAPRQ